MINLYGSKMVQVLSEYLGGRMGSQVITEHQEVPLDRERMIHGCLVDGKCMSPQSIQCWMEGVIRSWGCLYSKHKPGLEPVLPIEFPNPMIVKHVFSDASSSGSIVNQRLLPSTHVEALLTTLYYNMFSHGREWSSTPCGLILIWLVVWNMFFSHILGIIIPTDFHIFRKG